MAKRMVLLIVAVVTLATIFCACKGGNASDETKGNGSVYSSEGESNSQSSDKTDDSQSSESSDNDEVKSDENGEWWGIEF